MKKWLFYYVMMCIVVFLLSCKKDDVENPITPEIPNKPTPLPVPDGYIIKNAVTDVDGNVYDAAKIGDKVWMNQNLRTTHYANGDLIPLEDGYTNKLTPGCRYVPNKFDIETYGYLYDWASLMHGAQSSNTNPSGVQGVCPDGWHVPSAVEWLELVNYVSSREEYVCKDSLGHNSDDTGNKYIAKALSAVEGWGTSSVSCAPGNTETGVNNATGFSALPAGAFMYYQKSTWHNSGLEAFFWSSTENSAGKVHLCCIHKHFPYVFRPLYPGGAHEKGEAYSVRCVRNEKYRSRAIK